MAENQEMSPIEIKVARQIEVMIMSFRNVYFFYLDLAHLKKMTLCILPAVLLWRSQPSKGQVPQRTAAA